MIALIRLSFDEFVLKRDKADWEVEVRKPMEDRADRKSWRREVTSRIVVALMKFF
jgi:hypothetical protein